jgi:UDP-N-acetylmuramoyl-tripeptide--D-alanyl-D-alanine ligase
VIVVPDALAALQRLAYWWRRQLDIAVVCITGSNGKTSTKDFTTAVLSRRYRVSSTKGNLNNHIGVPLTVLATNPEDQVGVWEMGMNHSGELAPLCEIAHPKFGIITNIGTAHIEHLGSRDAIAEEKGTLARALPEDGILFIPASCDYYEFLRERTKAALVSVGDGRGIVRSENLRLEPDGSRFTLVIEGDGRAEVCLPVPGRHMVINALLAAAAGWKLGMQPCEIACGLNEVKISGGRFARRVIGGITVIDDTYNANPESMAAAIETLAEAPVPAGARRFVVLGRMGELGVHGPAAHHQIGKLAASHDLVVIAAGEGAEGIAEGAGGAKYFPVLADAAKWLAAEVKPGDAVLFKGSRSATIERVMNAAFPTH